MAMNFPSSPANGQTFSSGGGGPTYRYDSTLGVWNIDKTGGSGNVFISDTKPVNPFPGMRWYRSTDMREFIYYADTDGAQWIETSQSDSQRPASDNSTYTMRNGIWVKKSERIVLTGTTVAAWQPPSWATNVSLSGWARPGSFSNQYPYLQVGFGGTYLVTSGNYVASGFTHITANNTVSAGNGTSQVGALFTSGGNNGAVHWTLGGNIRLIRANNGESFVMDLTGTSYDAAQGAAHGFWSTYITGAPSSALAITDLRIVNSLGVAWINDSYLAVEYN